MTFLYYFTNHWRNSIRGNPKVTPSPHTPQKMWKILKKRRIFFINLHKPHRLHFLAVISCVNFNMHTHTHTHMNTHMLTYRTYTMMENVFATHLTLFYCSFVFWFHFRFFGLGITKINSYVICSHFKKNSFFSGTAKLLEQKETTVDGVFYIFYLSFHPSTDF